MGPPNRFSPPLKLGHKEMNESIMIDVRVMVMTLLWGYIYIFRQQVFVFEVCQYILTQQSSRLKRVGLKYSPQELGWQDMNEGICSN